MTDNEIAKCKTNLLTIIGAFTVFCNIYEEENIFSDDDLSIVGAMLIKLYAEGFNLTEQQTLNDIMEFKRNFKKRLN